MGNTTAKDTIDIAKEKHPHMSGEYISGWDYYAFTKETPPHEWGIPVLAEGVELRLGNTPT